VYNVVGFNFCKLGVGTQMKKRMAGLSVAQEIPQHYEDEEHQKWYKEKKRKDTQEGQAISTMAINDVSFDCCNTRT
jgi:hypothetical protein